MATGTVAGWSSPAIPFLQGNMGVPVENPITDEQASWVGSIVTLGCLVGAVPAGTLSHRLGRRVFLMALAVPLIIGWMLIIYGENNVSVFCFLTTTVLQFRKFLSNGVIEIDSVSWEICRSCEVRR